MKNVVKLFSVSLIAILGVACGAHAEIASVGYVNQIVNGLVIPDVNNGTLTIQQNGVDVATFGANAAEATTANIIVPTNVSELNNDSDFVANVNGGTPATGKVVTSVTKSGDTITATMDYVKIPVGDASGSRGVATIWVE